MAQTNYRQLARSAAQRHGLDPNVFERQIQQESGFNPNAMSPAGAIGIAQFMPGTARGVGINPRNPQQALDGAARLMASYVQKFGSYKNALVAYNAGPGAVGGRLLAETQNYVKVILGGRGGGRGVAMRTQPSSQAQPAAAPDPRRQIALSLLGFGGGQDSLDPMTLALQQAAQQGSAPQQGNAPQAPQPYGGPERGAVGGSPIAGERPHSATHPTAGLPGYPAYDYMARAGTPVVAPVSGRIIKLSGHDPSQGPTQGPHGPFGWSVYVQGNDGRTYFLTHLGSRNVHVGQTVKQGGVIGSVGNYAKWGGANHVHMGVHG